MKKNLLKTMLPMLCLAMCAGYLQAQDRYPLTAGATGVNLPSAIPVNADACGDFYEEDYPNVFLASQTLRAGNVSEPGHTTVHNGGALVLVASQSVEIKSGFWAQPGSYFHAYIDPVAVGGQGQMTDRPAMPATLALAAESAAELRIQPNPFSDFTTLEFALAQESQVDLAVFDAQGNLVRQAISNETRDAGAHSIRLECNDLPPGVYYCRLLAGRTVSTRKMVLMR